MIETIEKMLSDLERGRLSRRQFAVSLAALAASTSLAPAALATPAPTGFGAVGINHVTVRFPDLHRTSQFYQEFFGMPLKQQSATIHILESESPPFLALNRTKARLLRSVTTTSEWPTLTLMRFVQSQGSVA